MKKLLFLVVSFLFFTACTGINNTDQEGNNLNGLKKCNTTDPINNLSFIKEWVNSSSSVCPVHTIYTGIYKGEAVFMPDALSATCCGCGGFAAYNCEGIMLFACNLEESEKITDIKVLWQRK